MRRIAILALMFTGIFQSLTGQDLHYSYYQFAPLTVNPAYAGAFSGSYRVSGIYSEKQAAITARPYRTFTVSADAPIIKGIRKQDWVGIGFEASQLPGLNQSGLITDDMALGGPAAAKAGFQAWTTIKIGAAYHLSLDKKQTRIFTVGGQFGNNSRSFLGISQGDGRVTPMTGLLDKDIEEFNKKLKNSSQGGQGNTTDRLATAFKDVTVGLMYNQRAKDSDLKIGVAVEGITRPFSAVNDNNSKYKELKYIGLNIHGAYDMKINKKVHIIPGAYYYSLGPANGLNVNCHAEYLFNEDKEVTLTGGLGVRNLRAASLYAGADIKGVKVGFAYDIDLSSATIGSKGVGGFEVVASYIGKVYKKPKLKPEIFCPRL